MLVSEGAAEDAAEVAPPALVDLDVDLAWLREFDTGTMDRITADADSQCGAGSRRGTQAKCLDYLRMSAAVRVLCATLAFNPHSPAVVQSSYKTGGWSHLAAS